MKNQKKEKDLVKNEPEKFNISLFYHFYKNIVFLNQLNLPLHKKNKIFCNQKKIYIYYSFFLLSQFLYANATLSKEKKIFFLKKYFLLMLKETENTFFTNKIKWRKKNIIQKKLKQICSQIKKEKKRLKKYFLSRKIVFFYFKNTHTIPGFKKQQPLLNRTRREKYRNRLAVLIHRKLSLNEVSYEKQAQKKILRIKTFSSKIGILHYVVTTRNLKLTFTNAKKRVLIYLSCGNKKCRKSRRKKLKAKKAINDRMVTRIFKKGYSRIIIIFHGKIAKTFFLKKLFRKQGIKVLKRIYKKKLPHNGCRKKMRHR